MVGMTDPEMALIHIRNALQYLKSAADSFEKANVPKAAAMIRSMVADMTPPSIEPEEPEGAEIISIETRMRLYL